MGLSSGCAEKGKEEKEVRKTKEAKEAITETLPVKEAVSRVGISDYCNFETEN